MDTDTGKGKQLQKKNTTSTYICTICSKSFTTKSNINAHMKNIHKQFKKVTKSTLKCPLCTMQLENYGELDTHLTSNHNKFLTKEEHSFETSESFKAWKLEMEKETLSYFRIQNSRRLKYKKIEKFICHRSGTFTPRVIARKRALKLKGSNKIGSNCPARLVATTSRKGSIKVDYISTHIGHDLEVSRVNLTCDERQNIAGQLLQGIPSQRILQDIGDEFTINKRLSYTTRYDIHNIKRSFNIQSNVKSVDILNEKPRSVVNDPVLAYKPYGSEDNIIGKNKRLVSNSHNKVPFKLTELLQRHKLAEALLNDIDIVENVPNLKWLISAFKNKSDKTILKYYEIKLENEDKCNCILFCSDCKSCVHTFSCTCNDFTVQNNMCKHIHLICLKYPRKPIIDVNLEVEPSGDLINNTSDLEHNTISSHLQDQAKVKNLEMVRRENVLKKIDNLKKLIGLNSTNPEVISYAMKNLSTVTKGIHSIIKSSNTDPHNKKN